MLKKQRVSPATALLVAATQASLVSPTPTASAASAACPVPEAASVQVTQEITRETPGFTQGLIFADGVLYESTGAYAGHSVINRIDPGTGKVAVLAVTPQNAYGEGLALFRNRFIQLTWRDGLAFIYDRSSLKLLATRALPPVEGWGLTTLDSQLVLSDGSASLRFLDPKDFSIRREIRVKTPAGEPIHELNELEAARGMIYANVWHRNEIVEIDPATGCVRSRISLSPLLSRLPVAPTAENPEHVPNGIAYDPTSDQFFLTGKNWPKIFKVRLERPQSR